MKNYLLDMVFFSMISIFLKLLYYSFVPKTNVWTLVGWVVRTVGIRFVLFHAT